MAINGIPGTDYSGIINQTQTGNLENTLNNIDKDKITDQKMYEACKEFETYMIEQIYKSMEKTVMKADEDENQYMEYFGDMQVQEYAKIAMEQGGFGLAKQLYEAMVNNQGPTSITGITPESAERP